MVPPFGGGGTGAFSLPDHLHTDTDQDGGVLDQSVSLINDGVDDVTLEEWFDSKTGMDLLDSQVLTAAANYNFTPSTPLEFTDYNSFLIYFSIFNNGGGATPLQMRINNLSGTNYFYYGWNQTTGSNVDKDGISQTSYELVPPFVNLGSTVAYYGFCEVQLTGLNAAGQAGCIMNSRCGYIGSGVFNQQQGAIQSGTSFGTALSQIDIFQGAGTMTGTIRVNGIKTK